MLDKNSLLALLRSHINGNLSVSLLNGGFKVQLPFRDYMGDPIEMFVTEDFDYLIIDDLGHSSGVLFSMRQHHYESQGYQLVRNLAEAYHIAIDYDRGVLWQRLSLKNDASELLDFAKILIAVQTVIPELQIRKREGRARRLLRSRLNQDIKQLQLPEFVQKQVEVAGKHENWTVDYKYRGKRGLETLDVLLVVADLGGKEPIHKVEHVLTLAVDLTDSEDKRDLRIVYETDGDGHAIAAQRAGSLIADYQHRLGYRAYNYADLEQKTDFMALTTQELSPLTSRD